MKIYLQKVLHSDDCLPRVDTRLLAGVGIDVVGSLSDADYAIVNHMWGEKYHRPLPRSRVIAIYDESPAPEHLDLYDHPETFHSWFTLAPMTGPNVFRLTEDPIVFPYQPDTAKDVARANTKLRTRGVFFRGARRRYSDPVDTKYGTSAMYNVRAQLLERLSGLGTPTDVAGEGWGRVTKHDLSIWPGIKRFEMRNTGADFVLCAENAMMDDYITEKIHHAMQVDLVALYLGSPAIEEHVPAGAFINLNPYYDKVTHTVDAAAMHEILSGISQFEYDKILATARAWRRSDNLEERRLVQVERLTRMVAARLLGRPV